MKIAHAWLVGTRDILTMSGSRQRTHLKRPTWILVLVSLVSIFLIGAYVYAPGNSAACYMFSSSGCSMLRQPLPIPSRELTDDETTAQVVINEILKAPPIQSEKSKIAFMFLTPGSLPFEKLWDMFFYIVTEPEEEVQVLSSVENEGHEDRFSVYVHASGDKVIHISRYFIGRDIRSEKVAWGKISMLDAEKRLLANALLDPDNEHFVLLSDSCVPLHSFDIVYNYLMFTNISFIDCFEDPGPHGNGRYSEHMLPEIEKKDFRKGAQWFTMKRQHAIIVMADSLYYTNFKLYCKVNMDGRNCYPDEHYLPTLFHMIDPGGISNWSVTHVDWSEGKWHPKAYRTRDVTYELLRNISSIDETLHVTSNEEKKVMIRPCLWNGMRRPCYLFARKFDPEALEKLMQLFPNYSTA